MPPTGGYNAWHTKRVKDWSQYGDCDEECGAKRGEPCMSPPRPKGTWGGRRKRVTAHPHRPKIDQVYPEHAKLAAKSDAMGAVFDWVDFLRKKGWQSVPSGETFYELVDEFFEIDRRKIADESKEMWKAVNSDPGRRA